MGYDKTLNLPKTDFPMRAGLSQRLEPQLLAKWDDMGLYHKVVAANAEKPPFLFHDGPPYANGHIHYGTMLNKILKDIIVKHRNMIGNLCEYIPGWDCHGLPIEHNAEKELGIDKEQVGIPEFRERCRAYAQRYVDIQREEFMRLGGMGRWEEPYRTMTYDYEATIAREFGRFVDKGGVYRSKKPVYWCHACETALAEAEVEYADHESPSIFVKFPLPDAERDALMGHLQALEGVDLAQYATTAASFVIWTTTPWTIPANMAIALHPEFDYVALLVGDQIYMVAEELAEAFIEGTGMGTPTKLARSKGAPLEGLKPRHPWIDRSSPIVLADYVTLDAGTGCVHTAPGHGAEDYETGRRYGIDIYAPVDHLGRFTGQVPEFEGQLVFDANDAVCELIASKGCLLGKSTVSHSYPHCQRSKDPVIFRATDQWFIKVDHDDLRHKSIAEVDKVKWVPKWGRDRIRGMLETRPDWCISRQRTWGVPIVVFYCTKCGEALLDGAVVSHVADIFAREGSDAWFKRTEEELLPEGTTCPSCGASSFTKERDILDVWFDSGVSYAAVMEKKYGEGVKTDLYLEGSDQHRGWFHSTLLASVGTRDEAPYKTVLTHGFVVDGQGFKLSKTDKNFIPPEKTLKKFGAEIIRLWVAAEDYREDIRFSEEILKRMTDSYRKIRNTARFILGNIKDFDPSTAEAAMEHLEDFDKWILHRFDKVVERMRRAYEEYDFHVIYHTAVDFCTVDMSNLYMDGAKDRLYAEATDSATRRAAQATLWTILDGLTKLLAPVLSFTSEEIWSHLPKAGDDVESVFLTTMPEPSAKLRDDALADEWEDLLTFRSIATKALEEARNDKRIGHPLEAHLEVAVAPGSPLKASLEAHRDVLAVLNKVSGLTLTPSDEAMGEEGVAVTVGTATGDKCERCWNRSDSVGTHDDHPTLCTRCHGVILTQ